MTPASYQARRRLLAGWLRANHLDAALITSLVNIRYLTGFTGSNAMLLVKAKGSPHFLTDPRYTTQAAEQTGLRVRTVSGPLHPPLAELITKDKLTQIGFENLRISLNDFEAVSTRVPAAVEFRKMDSALETMRLVKSDEEIALIRRSVALNSAAFDTALATASPTDTERDLALALDSRMRWAGAEGNAFDTIVASGPRAALPHARPTAQRLGRRQLFLIDMGALLDGYCSDMTRMAIFGRPDSKMKAAHAAVLEAQLAAVAAIRPGVTAGSVDQAARDVLAKHKLAKLFVHSTGHGLGLEIHEQPRLGKDADVVLQPGMVVTVEPGIYEPGWGGIRIEDTVLVTATGAEILTPTAKDLRIL